MAAAARQNCPPPLRGHGQLTLHMTERCNLAARDPVRRSWAGGSNGLLPRCSQPK